MKTAPPKTAQPVEHDKKSAPLKTRWTADEIAVLRERVKIRFAGLPHVKILDMKAVLK